MSSTTTQPLPSCKLYDLVVDMDWLAVIRHAIQHPQDASYQDHHGHDGGDTPLYLACQFHAPVQAIKALLDAYPEAAHICNRNGNSPLHIACHFGASIDVLRVMVEADPSTVFLQTKWGKTPLRALHDGFSTSAANSGSDVDEELEQQWEKIMLLLRAAAVSEHLLSKDGNEWLILHAAVSLGAMGCPQEVFDMCLQRYGHQIRQEDPLGRLPLHVAAGPTKWCWPKQSRKYKPRERHVLESLLERNPEAARIAHVPTGGRLPLHTAIGNGHTWEGGVESLFLAAPDVIGARDPVTGLFPFMLAALPVGETNPSLTTIFMLLSAEPHVLASCARPTTLTAPRTIKGSVVLHIRQGCRDVWKSNSFAVSVAVLALVLGWFIGAPHRQTALD